MMSIAETSVFRFLSVLLLFIPSIGAAKEVYFSSEHIETVLIKANTPTIFRFPAPVRTAVHVSKFDVKPAHKQDPDYAVQMIKPRVLSGSQVAVFILSDSTAVKLRLEIVPHNSRSADVMYDLKDIADLAQNHVSNTAPKISAIDLMKAMIRGSWIAGYSHRSVSRGITRDGPLLLKLTDTYEGHQYKGFVFRIKNTSSRKVKIKLSDLSIGYPNKIILSQISHKMLKPKGKPGHKATLRIVALPSARPGINLLPYGRAKNAR